ncbi:MAG TPA: phospholipase D-like domain-containing protein [Gammaproteobacteria bacterium]|nr:phospholipase D-like domain-containing protein [Gammaproteobacteria bacterium]
MSEARNDHLQRVPLPARDERTDAEAQHPLLDELVDDPFSRAAGAPLIRGNGVRLLKDAAENYPAWLAAIRSASRHIHFETYFICDDEIGREFARALAEKARDGVAVRFIYDWFGNLGKASRRFWRDLRRAGVELRCYNPPRLESPFGWLNRDHRKMLAVDNEIAFVTGLCVGDMWVGDAARHVEPWRDTGVEIRGRAVAEIERNFAKIWALLGDPIPDAERHDVPRPAGNVALRIVATEPATAGILRVDQLVAALASSRLWLTDAYYAGVATYVQALRAAAKDGIDVRLLVPRSTDVPLLRPVSRAGYRPLLEAGVRVFEWNGTMLHAKSAVADGAWSRVGSTNLNIASWLGNCELDAVVEDRAFAEQMEHMYLEDLEYSTEIVLNERLRMRPVGTPTRPARPTMRRARGSAGRAAAGAMRLGRAVGAAFSDRRALGPVEARLMLTSGLVLCALALLVAFFPRVLAYPLSALGAWAGVSLLYRGYRLWRRRERSRPPDRPAH